MNNDDPYNQKIDLDFVLDGAKQQKLMVCVAPQEKPTTDDLLEMDYVNPTEDLLNGYAAAKTLIIVRETTKSSNYYFIGRIKIKS